MPFDLSFATPLVREVVLTVFIVLATLVAVRVGRRLIERYVSAPERQYRAVRYYRRTLALAAVLLILIVWSPGLRGLATVFTVIGAGFAIALREVLLSLAGWMRLNVRSLYEQGDRIEIGGVRGDVVDVRLLHTTLMEVGAWVGAEQSSGRLVHLPNSLVFQEPVHNYTDGFGFVWNEYAVTVTFDSDWKAAREIIRKHAEENADDVARKASRQLRRLAREYLVHYEILTPYVYTDITERGVRLTLRYLCEVRQRRGSENTLTTHLLERFAEHGGIELAPGLRASVGENEARPAGERASAPQTPPAR